MLDSNPPVWIAELLHDLVQAGRKGVLAEVQCRNGQVIVSVPDQFAPDEYDRVRRARPIHFGRVEHHIRNGVCHTIKVLYSLTEEDYRRHGAMLPV